MVICLLGFVLLFTIISASKLPHIELAIHSIKENLMEYYSGVELIPYQMDSSEFKGFPLPFDLIMRIFEYLGTEDLKLFSEVNRRALQFKTDFISLNLFSFNPRFLFKDQKFNFLACNYMSEHFPRLTSTKSPEIYDLVVLNTFKFLQTIQTIPKDGFEHVQLAIISFIHEIVFGPDSYVPTSLSEWPPYFCLLLQKYNLPRTMEVYFNYLQSQRRSAAKIIEIFTFLSRRPSIKAQKEFRINNAEALANMNPIYQMIFDLNSPDEMIDTVDKVRDLFYKLTTAGQSCLNYLDRIKMTEEIKSWIQENSGILSKNWFIAELYKTYRIGPNDPHLNYIWTRDQRNPFIIEEFLNIDHPLDIKLIINEVMRVKMPHLIKLFIVSELYQAGLLGSGPNNFIKAMDCFTIHNVLRTCLDINIIFDLK